MAIVYFKKERVSNSIKINGQAVLWESTGRDTGVRQFDEAKDAATVEVLNGFADKRKMGVVRISPQIYEALKKKSARPTSQPPRSTGFGPDAGIRVMDRDSVLLKAKGTPPPPPPAPVAAAPAVVEASPPPPNKPIQPTNYRPLPVAATAPKADPALKPEGTPVETPKAPKRTRAKKSVIDALVESERQA